MKKQIKGKGVKHPYLQNMEALIAMQADMDSLTEASDVEDPDALRHERADARRTVVVQRVRRRVDPALRNVELA